jgi:hypothetical protein
VASAKSALAADPVEIRHGIDLFFEPGDVIEARVLNAPYYGTCSGYFDNFEKPWLMVFTGNNISFISYKVTN